jgi:hypothetical protein
VRTAFAGLSTCRVTGPFDAKSVRTALAIECAHTLVGQCRHTLIVLSADLSSRTRAAGVAWEIATGIEAYAIFTAVIIDDTHAIRMLRQRNRAGALRLLFGCIIGRVGRLSLARRLGGCIRTVRLILKHIGRNAFTLEGTKLVGSTVSVRKARTRTGPQTIITRKALLLVCADIP